MLNRLDPKPAVIPWNQELPPDLFPFIKTIDPQTNHGSSATERETGDRDTKAECEEIKFI